MDYYADTAADRSAQLQLQAWHISSSPSWRGGFLPRLSSIPEAYEENHAERAGAAVLQQQQHSACCSQLDDCIQDMQQTDFLIMQQLCPMAEVAANAACDYDKQKQRWRGPPSGDDTSSCSSSLHQSADAVDTPNTGDVSAVVASTWATSIRHFTDCVPITPDSMCSTSTYLGTTAGPQRSSSSGTEQELLSPSQQQQKQQDKEQHLHEEQQQAVGVQRSCSLPNSNSSGSLLPGSDAAAAAANEAAVQASLLAALQELDDLEWCPWDRVTKWLENHTAVAAVAGESQTYVDQQPEARSSSSKRAVKIAAGDAASPAQQQPHTSVSSSPATPACDTAVLPAGQHEKALSSALQAHDAVFDAPAWWQEAVLARLQQQREAFQGSWWSRARVLASLAAVKAACALQI